MEVRFELQVLTPMQIPKPGCKLHDQDANSITGKILAMGISRRPGMAWGSLEELLGDAGGALGKPPKALPDLRIKVQHL